MWVFKCFENFTHFMKYSKDILGKKKKGEKKTQQYYNLKEYGTEQRSLDI